jgi:hypothetical protein
MQLGEAMKLKLLLAVIGMIPVIVFAEMPKHATPPVANIRPVFVKPATSETKLSDSVSPTGKPDSPTGDDGSVKRKSKRNLQNPRTNMGIDNFNF